MQTTNPDILIDNAEIFNGRDEATMRGNVLIRGNRIEKISPAPIPVAPGDNTILLDGTGRFLMPGLIDAHWHAYLCCNTPIELLTRDVSYSHLVAGQEAAATLQRGFTTIRDAGGPVFGLKYAIDTGVLQGPRIYPSGAMISQTSGHGDFRMIYEHGHAGCGCETARVEAIGASRIVDGADAVTTATRENLRQGASQIKLLTGGGAASLYDPLDVTEFFEEEIRAAVKAAEDWGTYVMVHVYTPEGIARALRAGVRSIEHGHLIDEPTMELLARSDAWLSTQPFTVEDNTYPTPEQQAKHIRITQGTDKAYTLARQYDVKLAWGTDLLFNPANTRKQNHGIVKLQKWFSNYRILRMVTYDNACLLALSGPRNPYPGKLGIIEPGAFADLLLVEGNPLENLGLMEDPATNFRVIVKNGVICKNTLQNEPAQQNGKNGIPHETTV